MLHRDNSGLTQALKNKTIVPLQHKLMPNIQYALRKCESNEQMSD